MSLPLRRVDGDPGALQHAAGDQEGCARTLGVGAGPDGDPFAPSGELAGDPMSVLERALTASATALRGVPADAADVAVPVPPGSLSAGLAAAGLMPVALAIVEPLRGFAFGPAIAAEDGDGPVERLLRHLGRDPGWSA